MSSKKHACEKTLFCRIPGGGGYPNLACELGYLLSLVRVSLSIAIVCAPVKLFEALEMTRNRRRFYHERGAGTRAALETLLGVRDDPPII